MEMISLINEFGSRPIPHSALLAWFGNFKNPNDKIHRMTEEGKLLPVKRGLYFINHELTGEKPSPFLIANLLHGPSYVSSDSALQYFNAIPERVFSVTSVTPKISKEYETPFGRFIYHHLPINFYMTGIRNIALPGNLNALMAIAEKALLDKLVLTKGVILRSSKDAAHFFLEDLRIDEDWLKELDIMKINKLRQNSPKARSIEFLVNLIKNL